MRRLPVLCALAFLLFAPSAQAQQAPRATVIAIVDVQRILQESGAAKSVQTQVEAYSSKFQTQIAAEEKELREAEQQLTTLRQSGNSQAYSEQEQKLRQRFMTVERHVQSRRKALDQAYTESMAKVRQTLIDVVEAVSKTHGVTLAIVKQQVIWNDSSIDITQEVLDQLNRKLPHLDVQLLPEEKFDPETQGFNTLQPHQPKQPLERKR